MKLALRGSPQICFGWQESGYSVSQQTRGRHQSENPCSLQAVQTSIGTSRPRGHRRAQGRRADARVQDDGRGSTRKLQPSQIHRSRNKKAPTFSRATLEKDRACKNWHAS